MLGLTPVLVRVRSQRQRQLARVCHLPVEQIGDDTGEVLPVDALRTQVGDHAGGYRHQHLLDPAHVVLGQSRPVDHHIVAAAAYPPRQRDAEFMADGFEQTHPAYGSGARMGHHAIDHCPTVDVDIGRELKPCRSQLK